MATTETTPGKSSETNDLSGRQVDGVAEDNRSKGNVSAAASQDATDILSILDGLGSEQPTTDQLPEDTPLSIEEQNKLSGLLGDTKPEIAVKANEQAQISEQFSASELENEEIQDTKTTTETPLSDTENDAKQTESHQTESTVTAENHENKDKLTSVLDAIQNESSAQSKLPVSSEIKNNSPQGQSSAPEHEKHIEANFTEPEQTISDDSFSKTKSQIEALAAERNAISKELSLTENHVKKLEDDHFGKKAENNQTQDIEKLRSELTKISKWHENLSAQVQKLLKIAENSNADRETLEVDLAKAHETICNLHKQHHPLQEKLEDCDNTINELRTQLVEQSEKLTITYEKLQHEVSQRRKAEQMLNEIKSRLTPLTRSKSVTQTKSPHS